MQKRCFVSFVSKFKVDDIDIRLTHDSNSNNLVEKSREIVSEKKSTIDFRSCEIRTLAVRKVTRDCRLCRGSNPRCSKRWRCIDFRWRRDSNPRRSKKWRTIDFQSRRDSKPRRSKKWRCIDIRWRRDSNPRGSKNIEKWKWRDVDFESIWDSNLSWIRNSKIRRRTSRNRYFGSH